MHNTTVSPAKPSTAELQELKQALIVKREQVLALYRHDVKVGQQSTDVNSDDFADRANNSYNRETMFALSDTERQLMNEIDAALDRLEAGTYGICENCQCIIAIERLRAIPWARYCIDCAELAERGLLDP
ncbi:MAG: TraR/DksA family transcriptional regulator [Acidobacteriota bacterium]